MSQNQKRIENRSWPTSLYRTHVIKYPYTIITSSLGLIFAKAISGQIRKLITDIAKAEKEGDLTKRLAVPSKDEIGELTQWFNTYIEKLHGIIVQLAETTEQVASAGTELSSTAEQIAAGAEETSAQADTVASATEEMSATATQIATNCVDAVQEVDTATSAADNGREIVQNTINGMNQIAKRVQESAETIKVLQESSQKIRAIASYFP